MREHREARSGFARRTSAAREWARGRDKKAPARACEADGARTRWSSSTQAISLAAARVHARKQHQEHSACSESCVCEAREATNKDKQGQTGTERRHTAEGSKRALARTSNTRSVKQSEAFYERAVDTAWTAGKVQKGSEISEREQGTVLRGGGKTCGQGDFAAAVPVALSVLVGRAARLYEKKMRVRVAFALTMPYRTVSTPFFVRSARRVAMRLLAWLALWLSVPISMLQASLAEAQQAPAAPSPPSWAIEVAPMSLCADDGSFAERLSASIPARQRSTVEQAELRARVSVARDRTASLSVYDQLTRREAGQRQITLPRGGCREAADALALVIAVMVEAGRPLPNEQPPEEPEPPPEPPKEPEPQPQPPTRDEPPEYKRPERYAWQGPPAGHDISLGVGLLLGLLPSDGLGGNLGWGIRGSRIWPIWLEATGWLPQESRDRRAVVATAYGLVSTCPLYMRWAAVRIRLCPGVGMGAVWAEGRSLPSTTTSVRLLTMAALTAGVHVRIIGPLELVLAARMEVPFRRPRFIYRRSDDRYPVIHESTVIAGSFFGGLGLCFR